MQLARFERHSSCEVLNQRSADLKLVQAYELLVPWNIRALLDAAHQFSTVIPAPLGMNAFDGKWFSRLPGHRRSFFLKTGPYCVGIDQPVLVIKGCEAASENLRSDLQALQTSSSPEEGLNLLEYLVLVERKLPLAVSKREAFDEFSVAEQLQRFAIKRGILARTSFPIVIHEHSYETTQRYREIVSSLLTKKSIETFTRIANEGVFAFSYIYPTAPVRVSNFPRVRNLASGQKDATRALVRSYDVEARWRSTLQLFYDAGLRIDREHCFKNGICVDPNNATIDGGFLDLDGCSMQVAAKQSVECSKFLSLIEMQKLLEKTISTFSLKLG